MTVDVVVDGLFRRLCAHRRAEGVASDMSLAELRLALGVTEPQRTEGITACQWVTFDAATSAISYANARLVLRRAQEMITGVAMDQA